MNANAVKMFLTRRLLLIMLNDWRSRTTLVEETLLNLSTYLPQPLARSVPNWVTTNVNYSNCTMGASNVVVSTSHMELQTVPMVSQMGTRIRR